MREFYSQHNPSKIADIPDILSKYAGREAELLARLKKQYGVTDDA